MRTRTVAVVTTALLTLSVACRQADEQAQQADHTSVARVVRSGFSVHGGRLGAAAIVRADRAVGAVGLKITLSAGDRNVAVERDSLPFCLPRTDCPWGFTLTGPDVEDADRVEITVETTAEPADDAAQIVELDVESMGGKTSVLRNGTEGTVYVIASKQQALTSGASFFAKRGERGATDVTSEFPDRNDQRIEAFLYTGAVPAHVNGPAD